MEGGEKCSTCDSPAKTKCYRCNQAWYCSEQHKAEAWNEHESQCKPYKIQRDSILGRYLVASRNIAAGETILKEVPLVKGPAQITAPVCLGCYRLISSDHYNPCDKCGWPMCTVLCAHYRDHVPECTYTTGRGRKISISDFVFPHPNYQCLFVLRCLYQKEHKPDIWAKLMDLDSQTTARIGTDKYEAERISIAQFIRTFYQLKDQFTEDEILKVCGIVQVNGHEVPLTDPPFVAIYSDCSILEHNCSANCSKSFTSDWEVIVTASVPINEGDHLSICYTDSLWGTQNRRHYLKHTKFFECDCERCKDTTEFGTNFSAVRCRKAECPGYMLPASFLVDDQPWTCTTCGYLLATDSVLDILERVGRDLSAMQKGDAASCQLFLDHYGKVLHPNHYYMTDVRLALGQIIGHDGYATVTDEELALKLETCRLVADISKTLNPAENRVRGVQLFEQHAALTEMGRRGTVSGQLDAGQLTRLLLQSRKVLEESMDLLKNEAREMPEGQIAIQAGENLNGLNDLLASIATADPRSY